MKKVISLNENDIEKLVRKIIKEDDDMEGGSRYMFFSNLQQIKRQCEYLLEFDENQIEEILENGHDWAQDHIAEAKNNMDQVFDFLMNEIKGDGDDYEKENQMSMYNESRLFGNKIVESDEFGSVELLSEGSKACANRGLGKPWLTPDGPKKRSVCVKNPSGNVVKVNFGDPNMRIKKSNPERRKSFRARHKCDNPGPRWKARYWSCRAW